MIQQDEKVWGFQAFAKMGPWQHHPGSRIKDREVRFRNLELNCLRNGFAEFSFSDHIKYTEPNDLAEHEYAVASRDLTKSKPGPGQHSDQQKAKDEIGSPLGAAELPAQAQRLRFGLFSTGAGILEPKDW